MLLDKLALLLVIVGALNWGGIGLFGFDTVAFLFGGQMALLSRVVYALVGLAGLWCITLLFRPSDEETGHAPHAARRREADLSTQEGSPPIGRLPTCPGTPERPSGLRLLPAGVFRRGPPRSAPPPSGTSGPCPAARRRPDPAAPSCCSGPSGCRPPRRPSVRRAGTPA